MNNLNKDNIKKILIYFSVCLILVMSIAIVCLSILGSVSMKINSVTQEFKILFMLDNEMKSMNIQKIPLDLNKEKLVNIFSKDILKNKSKNSTLLKLGGGRENLTIETNIKNESMKINSYNYLYSFCEDVQDLLKKDPRDTFSGKIAFLMMKKGNKIIYEKNLNNFYDEIKSKRRNIKVNGIPVNENKYHFDCSKNNVNSIQIENKIYER